MPPFSGDSEESQASLDFLFVTQTLMIHLIRGKDCRDLPVKLMPNISSILTCCSRRGCVHLS